MARGTTTTNDLAPAIRTQYADKLLTAQTRACIYSLPLTMVDMKERNGDKIKFTRPGRLPLIKDPLGNTGHTPPPQKLTREEIEGTIQWYGGYSINNEQVIMTNQCPILNMGSEEWGRCMKESNDQLMADVLTATSSQYPCAYGTNGDVPTEYSRDDSSLIYEMLRGHSAPQVFSGKQGSVKVGSAPIGNAYMVLCHTDLISSLRRLPNWVNKINYPNQKDLIEEEEGCLDGFRFFVSEMGSINATPSAAGKTVYNLTHIARDAAAAITLGGNGQMIYHKASDALEQNATLGVKWVQCGKILQDAYMMNVKATKIILGPGA